MIHVFNSSENEDTTEMLNIWRNSARLDDAGRLVQSERRGVGVEMSGRCIWLQPVLDSCQVSVFVFDSTDTEHGDQRLHSSIYHDSWGHWSLHGQSHFLPPPHVEGDLGVPRPVPRLSSSHILTKVSMTVCRVWYKNQGHWTCFAVKPVQLCPITDSDLAVTYGWHPF